MMNISEFTHTCHYNFPIPYDGKCNFSPFEYTQLSDDNDIFIYNSEYEFVDEISQAIANKLYDTVELLKDVPPTTDEIWEVRGNRGFYFDCDNYFNLPHITLSDLGIDTFVIKGHEDPSVVYYSRMSNYDKMVIDSFIYDACAEKIIEYLSKLSCFKVSKRKVEGIPGCILAEEDELVHINSLNQLRTYIDWFERKNLDLFDTLLDCKIVVPSNLINMEFEDIPRFVEVGIKLHKTWCAPGYRDEIDGFYINDNIRLQVIVNPDKSLLLQPFPLDMERVIKRQFDLWKEYTYDRHDNYWFIPLPLRNMAIYLMKNRIKSQFGIIDRVLDGKESYDLACEIDNEEYENCFIGNIQMFSLPETRWSEYISVADRIIVKIK